MRITFLAALFVGFALVSCNTSKEKEDTQEIESQTTNPDTEKGKPTPAEASNFDINKIPLSDFTIVDIPFFNLPEGYAYSSNNNRDYESIRFWTGNDFVFPEGSLFYGRIATVENKQFSTLELTKSLDKIFTDAGGVQVFQGKVPVEAINKSEESNPVTDYGLKNTAYGFQGYAKTWTYVIRQETRNIWLQLNESDDNASLHIAILNTNPVEATSELVN